MPSKTFPEIDVMVKRLENLMLRFPPSSGHKGTMRWIIADLQGYKGGRIPETREAKDWIYANETGLNRYVMNHENYLKLVSRLTENKTVITFDEFGVVNNAVHFVMLDLGIKDSIFDCVGMRMYHDHVLQMITPGHFQALPPEQWELNPNTKWLVCRECSRVTYNNPCDFCGCDRITQITKD